jgi:hypothetical protein
MIGDEVRDRQGAAFQETGPGDKSQDVIAAPVSSEQCQPQMWV